MEFIQIMQFISLLCIFVQFVQFKKIPIICILLIYPCLNFFTQMDKDLHSLNYTNNWKYSSIKKMLESDSVK